MQSAADNLFKTFYKPTFYHLYTVWYSDLQDGIVYYLLKISQFGDRKQKEKEAFPNEKRRHQWNKIYCRNDYRRPSLIKHNKYTSFGSEINQFMQIASLGGFFSLFVSSPIIRKIIIVSVLNFLVSWAQLCPGYILMILVQLSLNSAHEYPL